MLFKIEGYSYRDLNLLKSEGFLHLEPFHYQELGIRQYFKMRKSLKLLERIEKANGIPAGIKPEHQAKAKAKYPPGTRWITIHPQGREKGVPVLIREYGDGTAHVIGGAGGRLNMMKLSNIKSLEQYKQAIQARKELEQTKKEKKKEEEEAYLKELNKEQRKAYKESKKRQKREKIEKEIEQEKKIAGAEEEFVTEVAEMLGWDLYPIEADYDEQKDSLIEQLQELDAGDPMTKQVEKELQILEKAKKRALKSQRKNIVAQTKDIVRKFQKDLIDDVELRQEVERRIEQPSQAGETIQTELTGKGKGFKTEYRESAEEKGELTEAELKQEKKEEFEKRMEQIAEEVSPQTASMIRKGVETNKDINEIKKTIYEEKEKYETKIVDVDTKVTMLKKYLEMKHKLEEAEKEKPGGINEVQLTIDGTPEDQMSEKINNLKYGNGVKLDWMPTSEDLARSLMEEEERLQSERQSALNGSFLEEIEENKGGVEKWIANGNYNGFNSISLSVLKYEGLNRDTVDILGIGSSAKLLSSLIRQENAPEEYADIAKGMEAYHEEVNEGIVKDALERGQELINRAETIQEEIANNPDELTMINELNESRLQYLDEANRIMGQALGSLEASAAMVAELKNTEDPQSIDTNLGKISNEEAIVRMRALGLQKGEYEINTIDRNKIIKINKDVIDKLVNNIDQKEVNLQNEVEAIKAGAHDKKDWLPAGIISRPEETFQDPGPDAQKSDIHIDNQTLPQDKNTVEALHRTLGAIPEGSLAFKQADDLTPQEMTDLRRYWENDIYRGSMAESTAERQYQEGKGKSAQGLWSSFLNQNGGNRQAAFEIINQDLTVNHSTADMFGMQEVPPFTKVREGEWDTYRHNVKGVNELFIEVENLETDLEQGFVSDKTKARQEIEKKKGELPERLTELYENQMKNHYLKYLSGATEAELEAGQKRQEKTPWGEYVRMHGDISRAQEAVLDKVKGNFLKEYAKNHGQVHGTPLKTEAKKIRNYQDHMLGMLGKEDRDSIINKVQAELASAGATVAHREQGKFAKGSWKEAALKEIVRRQQEASQQLSMFGEEDVKQDDGTETVIIGKRAEEQLKQLIPQVAANQRRGQKYKIFANLSMSSDQHIQQQRAIKMFEKVKKMNLTFGTGKGKSITSIGAFTHLKEQGKAKRAIFAVPSVVQAQFGGELSLYAEPNKYQWSADPGMSREKRIKALKNGKLDMVVFTHQSLRDDLVHIMAKHQKMNEEAMKKRFNESSTTERKTMLSSALKARDINFDMLVVDESHYTVKRKGKPDSTLSNIMEALNQNTEYFMNQSATPVKNDVSEAYDMLKKVDPIRFSDREEFYKRYGVDSSFTKESLQRLISRYNYASPTITGVKRNERIENVKLSKEQSKAYHAVGDAFKSVSKASREGRADIEAMRLLSPNSFKGVSESKHEEIARRLQPSVGIIKEEALNRVVNQTPQANNAKIDKVIDIISEKFYQEDRPSSGAKAGDMQPGVIFAHNIESINQLQSSLESKGMRVGVIQGSMNGKEKEMVKNAYNPTNPKDRQYDVLLLSDAGATGLNLQNSKYLINYDLPHTSWVREQRMGRIDRHGQSHAEIDYHDIITDTEHESIKWNRIQRKAELGAIVQTDPGSLDDTGLAEMIAIIKQDRYNQGMRRIA